MEKDTIRSHNNSGTNTITNNRSGGAESTTKQTASDFGLQWGNRKRLRCMKVQAKDESNHNNNSNSNGPAHRTTVRVDRRVVRPDHNKDANNNNQPSTTNNNNNNIINNNINNHGYGYFNLRQRPSSPSFLQGSHRVLRNSENSSAMRGQSNGGVRRLASPDRRGNNNNNNNIHNNNNHHHENNHNNNNNKSGASSETAQDSKKGGGSSSGSGEAAAAAAAPPVWPPKFVIALTNKEKEEDFFVFKGSKLPQRPKKRAKFIQRTLNLVSPGAWLCDLTLERYEVREKKVSKKRPRGLKAMGNMDSDSE